MKTNHEAIFASLAEDLAKKHGWFVWNVDFETLISIVGQVQLALRHPANIGPSATQSRRAVEKVIAMLETASPGIAKYLNMGFDPAHDVPVGPAEKSKSITK